MWNDNLKYIKRYKYSESHHMKSQTIEFVNASSID